MSMFGDKVDGKWSRDQVVLTQEEFSRLKVQVERLEKSEKRSLEISKHGAKSFARSARTIAYLESECLRLRTLVDHFRLVNSKLTSDMKAANEEGLLAKSLEQRLRVCHENEDGLHLRISSLEAALQAKENESLAALQRTNEYEEKRADDADREIAQLNDKLRQSQEKLRQFQEKSRQEREVVERTMRTHSDEVKIMREKMSRLEVEVDGFNKGAIDHEATATSLRVALREKESELIDARSKMGLLKQDSEMTKEGWDRHRRELENDLKESLARSAELETIISSLKSKLVEADTRNVMKDENIANALTKQVTFADECRQLRTKCDALGAELASLTDTNDQLQGRMEESEKELEATRELYVELKDVTHRQVLRNLLDTKDLLRLSEEELSDLKSEMATRSNEAQSLRVSLDASDKRCHQLQSNLATAEGKIQAQNANIAAISADNDDLRTQLDELASKFKTITHETSLLRASLSSRDSDINGLVSRVNELEECLSDARHKHELVEEVELEMSNHWKTLVDSLSTKNILTFPKSTVGFDHHSISTERFATASSSSEILENASSQYNSGSGSTLVGVVKRYVVTEKIKKHLMSFKEKSEQLADEVQKQQEKIGILKKELDGERKKNERAEQALSATKLECDSLQNHLENADEDIATLRSEILSLRNERDDMLTSIDDLAHKVRTILRALDGSLSDAIARANLVTAGRYVISLTSESEAGSTQLMEPPSSEMRMALVTKRDVAHSGLDLGAPTLLATSASLVKSTVDAMCNALEVMAADSLSKKKGLDKSEATFLEREKSWQREKTGLMDRVCTLEETLAIERDRINNLEIDREAARREADAQSSMVEQLAQSYTELEEELAHSKSNIEEFQSALNEAESMITQLSQHDHAMQSECEAKADEIISLTDKLEYYRRRCGDCELDLEKASTALERMKADKCAIENVRKSMDGEIDRMRLEIATLKAQCRGADENRSSFEIEKLLAALGTTLDQLSYNLAPVVVDGIQGGSNDDGGRMCLFAPLAPRLRQANSEGLGVAERVEVAVKRLGEFRSWSRDESRSRVVLQEHLRSLEQDVHDHQARVEDSEHRLKSALQNVTDRENELTQRSRELSELQALTSRRQDEIDRLKLTAAEQSNAMDEQLRVQQQHLGEIQLRDADIGRLKMEVESLVSNNGRLQEQVATGKLRVRELQQEIEQCNDALRSARASNSRLNASLELLERGLERDKSERSGMEKRLAEADSSSSQVMKLSKQVQDIEVLLEATKEQLSASRNSNEELETKLAQLMRDIEGLTKRLQSTSTRLDTSSKEKSILQEELDDLKHQLRLAHEERDTEYNHRVRLETALEVTKEAADKRAAHVEYAALVEQVEVKFSAEAFESEKLTLQSEISSLREALELRNVQKAFDDERHRRVEAECVALRSELDIMTVDYISNKDKVTSVLDGARKVRDVLNEAATHMWEIINVAVSDAKVVGIDIMPSSETGNAGLGVGASVSDLNDRVDSGKASFGLEEALGVPELSRATTSLREVMAWIREAPKSRQDLENSIRRIENENNRLQRELLSAESKSEDRLNRLRDEIEELHKQISDLRRSEALGGASSRQMVALEAALKQEREDKEKAMETSRQLRDQLETCSLDLAVLQEELRRYGPGDDQATMATELDNAKADLIAWKENSEKLRSELDAVTHHRTVLNSAIEQLEKQLRGKVDALAEALVQVQALQNATIGDIDGFGGHAYAEGLSTDVNRVGGRRSEEEEALQRQIARFRARSSAMEELVKIYRMGIMALYPDGSTYSSFQFQQLPFQDGTKADGNEMGWIEREIDAVRRSFDDEVRLLEVEVGELRAKLRQSGSYISELRRRFEESMKAMYRPDRDSSREGLMQQFDQLSSALDKCENEKFEISEVLASERANNRRRHSTLVENLTKTLRARDAAMSAVKRLESYCADAGMTHLGIYESLQADLGVEMKSDLVRTNAVDYLGSREATDQQRTIHSLMRGLVEADHEIVESERRARRVVKRNERADSATRVAEIDSKVREREQEKDRLVEKLRDERVAMGLVLGHESGRPLSGSRRSEPRDILAITGVPSALPSRTNVSSGYMATRPSLETPLTNGTGSEHPRPEFRNSFPEKRNPSPLLSTRSTHSNYSSANQFPVEKMPGQGPPTSSSVPITESGFASLRVSRSSPFRSSSDSKRPSESSARNSQKVGAVAVEKRK